MLRLKVSLNGEVNSPCDNFAVRIFKQKQKQTDINN